MTSRSIPFLVVFVVLLPIMNSIYPQDTSMKKTVLTNCTVIDCTGTPPMEVMSVVIADDTIEEIQQGIYRPLGREKDVSILDLNGAFVLPGLWNMHGHLSDLLPDVNDILGTEPVLPATIRAGRNAMDALKRGFTGLRLIGERDYIDLAWKAAFASGVFLGPRLFASGKIVTSSRAHSSEPAWPVEIFADGPEEMRKALLENIGKGIDLVKIFAPQLTDEEMAMIIEIAHNHGLKVTAHSGGESAHRAVVVGVDCIEHGTMMSDDTIALMAKKGTFFCPTVVCNLSEEYIREREDRLAKLGFSRDKNVVEGRILVAHADVRPPEVAARHREIIVKASQAGVKILCGSDSNPLGELGILEIEQLYLSG